MPYISQVPQLVTVKFLMEIKLIKGKSFQNIQFYYRVVTFILHKLRYPIHL
jgi:hypothetical protein